MIIKNFVLQQPAKPPVFTKKIQPCRAFEQEQARFEVEFDGDPLPTIKWYREDFPIQNSPDFQIHTFSTKSILIIRQVKKTSDKFLKREREIFTFVWYISNVFKARDHCIAAIKNRGDCASCTKTFSAYFSTTSVYKSRKVHLKLFCSLSSTIKINLTFSAYN